MCVWHLWHEKLRRLIHRWYFYMGYVTCVFSTSQHLKGEWWETMAWTEHGPVWRSVPTCLSQWQTGETKGHPSVWRSCLRLSRDTVVIWTDKCSATMGFQVCRSFLDIATHCWCIPHVCVCACCWFIYLVVCENLISSINLHQIEVRVSAADFMFNMFIHIIHIQW